MAATIMIHRTEEFSVHTQVSRSERLGRQWSHIVVSADGPEAKVTLFLDENGLGKLETAIAEFRKQGSPEPIGS